jgi:predicted nucleic acid-binding Zn ribbon protein
MSSTSRPLEGAVKNIFQRLSHPQQQNKMVLVDRWPQIAGEQVSRRTKPRFTPDKQVAVWVDDSTLAFELSRRHKLSILKRLQNEFGEEEVRDVKFFVGEIR